MSEELINCPYCGGDAQIKNDGNSHDVLGCCDPDCIGSEIGYHYLRDDISMRQQLIDQWNTRALTPKQQCADEMYEFLESLQLDVTNDYRRDEILAKARGEKQ